MKLQPIVKDRFSSLPSGGRYRRLPAFANIRKCRVQIYGEHVNTRARAGSAMTESVMS